MEGIICAESSRFPCVQDISAVMSSTLPNVPVIAFRQMLFSDLMPFLVKKCYKLTIGICTCILNHLNGSFIHRGSFWVHPPRMSSLLICVLLALALSLHEGRFRLPVSTRMFLPAKSSSRRRMGDVSRINSSVGDSESVEFKNMELVPVGGLILSDGTGLVYWSS